MGKLRIFESITLDGVMQSPARPDEDTRDGFESGGWAVPYADPAMWEDMGSGSEGGLLLGRRTYEDLYSVWPNRTDNPFTDVLNRTQKYVASKTLAEPLPWMNSTLVRGDVAEMVAELKAPPDYDLTVLGSGVLVRTLVEADLVDQFQILIHPLVLGTGRRLFPEGAPPRTLALVGTKTTKTGVVMCTYRRD